MFYIKRTSTATWHKAHNRWQINVQKNNIRKSFYSSIKGIEGKRECHRKADEWLENEDKKKNLQKNDVELKILYDEWIKEIKIHSKGYRGNYLSFGKIWIKPNIGEVLIKDVTEYHIQQIINLAYKKGLSKKSLQNIRSCLIAFIKYCRKRGLTTLLPEDIAIPKSAVNKEKTILQPTDLEKLFSINTTILRGEKVFEHYIYAFRLEVLTGLRPGEIVGLKWEDIDLKTGKVSLARSINRYNEITTGKNLNAQ